MKKIQLLIVAALLATLAAISVSCGGDSNSDIDFTSSPRASTSPGGSASGQNSNQPAIRNVESVVLSQRDMPLDFSRADDESSHLSAEESCSRGSPDDAAKQECLSHMSEWRRLDSYQVIFRAINPLATLTGTGMFEVLNISSVHQDADGAAKAYAWGKDQLQARINESKDTKIVSIPTVGEESTAFVVETSDFIFGQQIQLSYYSIDFRRGNVLVRVATVAPTVLAKVDNVLALARIVDERIKKGGETPPPVASPSS